MCSPQTKVEVQTGLLDRARSTGEGTKTSGENRGYGCEVRTSGHRILVHFYVNCKYNLSNAHKKTLTSPCIKVISSHMTAWYRF